MNAPINITLNSMMISWCLILDPIKIIVLTIFIKDICKWIGKYIDMKTLEMIPAINIDDS